MAWTTPSTFVTGDVLSAAQLNIIRDDLEYLYGLAGTVNVPTVQTEEDLRTTLASNKSYFQIRHKAQYLNLYLSWLIDGGWVDHLQLSVKIGGYELTTGGGSPVDPWVPGGASPKYFTWDVSSLTVGTWYEIEIDAVAHDAAHAVSAAFGSSYFRILRLFESDTSYA